MIGEKKTKTKTIFIFVHLHTNFSHSMVLLSIWIRIFHGGFSLYLGSSTKFIPNSRKHCSKVSAGIFNSQIIYNMFESNMYLTHVMPYVLIWIWLIRVSTGKFTHTVIKFPTLSGTLKKSRRFIPFLFIDHFILEAKDIIFHIFSHKDLQPHWGIF